VKDRDFPIIIVDAHAVQTIDGKNINFDSIYVNRSKSVMTIVAAIRLESESISKRTKFSLNPNESFHVIDGFSQVSLSSVSHDVIFEAADENAAQLAEPVSVHVGGISPRPGLLVVDGNKIVNARNEEQTLIGFNMGDHPRAFNTGDAEVDAQAVVDSQAANCVWFGVEWGSLEVSASPSDFTYNEKVFDYLVERVEALTKRGIYVIIRLHADWDNDSNARNLQAFLPALWLNSPGDFLTRLSGNFYLDTGAGPHSGREHLKRVWLEIAKRFIKNHFVVGYAGLVDEPYYIEKEYPGSLSALRDGWHKIVDDVTAAIRRTGDEHIMFIQEAPFFNYYGDPSPGLYYRPYQDPNTVSEVHWFRGITGAGGSKTVCFAEPKMLEGYWGESLPNTGSPVVTPTGRHKISEASGIVASRKYPGVYWVIQDSGNSPTLYAMNEQGVTIAEFPVLGASNRDWEDIAIDDDDNIWIGDFGDNSAVRSSIQLYRIQEPDPRFSASHDVSSEKIECVYPNGAADAEGMFSWNGIIYIVQKRSRNAPVWALPRNWASLPQPISLEHIGTWTGGVYVAGADISRDGTRLAFLSTTAPNNDLHWIIERSSASTNIADFFTNPVNTRQISFPNEAGEGIGFVQNLHDFMVISESGGLWRVSQAMAATPCSITTFWINAAQEAFPGQAFIISSFGSMWNNSPGDIKEQWIRNSIQLFMKKKTTGWAYWSSSQEGTWLQDLRDSLI